MNEYMEKLKDEHDLPDEAMLSVLRTDAFDDALFAAADAVRQRVYGKAVFVRGLIEFTNYCKNDCYYCGIRCSNKEIQRYRLDKETILACCANGYTLGYRTFVLQGGEDPYFTDARICDLVQAIRTSFPDCAITLSIGEKSRDSYRAFYEAGANRYLLRHETADNAHYASLHPASLSAENRKRCLFDLKEIGYQVGSGFMVGSPGQTAENLLADLRFLQKLDPDMIGIGPFIPAQNTPFANENAGSLALTLRLLAVLRLLFPHALLPATTALGTIHPQGREMGLRAGANVVMPNLSPTETREKYALYDNKLCTGEEAAECRACLETRVRTAGYEIVTDRGDVRRG
ncbi:MAG: [Clostridia bacterium]|nr:[FeFe] hydrogenase H-cluster radical SAM maturase HydE [Clostridia bacterium]